ncbi:MAG TPA: homoserine dehydrogenase [Rhizomicrobium sp.]|nr:homoserine dehydrogenase [Rhizomicrobium sp.]
MTTSFKIAIAGLGTVGGGVVKALAARGEDLSRRAGRKLEITGVSARDKNKARGFDVTGWTDDPLSLARGDADVVVELIGGDEGIARQLVEIALNNKKHVVTANKALLAKHGLALAQLAEKNGVTLKFEAAAAGGIPIVKALREGLIAQPIDAVKGILNGTCNYILTEMESSGRPFTEVLKEAQAKGYAEADPTLDVGGGDTAHKLALLASLAFGTVPDLNAVAVEGIAHITPDDIAFASEFGFRIKLLGVAKRMNGKIDQKVHPAMVRVRSALANVSGAANGVLVDAGEAGSFFFSGRGAGEAPTASAVIADIVEAAAGGPGESFSSVFGRPATSLARLNPADGSRAVSAWYLRFEVLDVPGVLASIAGNLAEAGVSIESMIQRGRAPGEPVAIVMITHETAQASVERALKAIGASDKVRARPCMIPMEA